MLGTVLWYSELKACGFLKPDGAGPDGNVFVHVTAVPKEAGRQVLYKGERVSFEVGEHKGRPVAANIQRIKADLPTSLSKKAEVDNGRN